MPTSCPPLAPLLRARSPALRPNRARSPAPTFPHCTLSRASQGGLFTCLPLTGVTTLKRLQALPASEHPDVVVRSVAQLAGLPV